MVLLNKMDSIYLHDFTRETTEDFEIAVNFINPIIVRKNITFPKAIPVNGRLNVTLR